MDETKLLPQLLGILDQIKLHHWSTTSYSAHKALDGLYSSLSDKIDTFVESYIGRFQKQPIKSFAGTIKVNSDSKPTTVMKYLESVHDMFTNLQTTFKQVGELVNILDEMRQAIDQCMYLLHLS